MFDIFNHVDNFLKEEVRLGFERYGLLYKRGLLLYGPPGTGKTSLVNQIITLCASEKDMIILDNPPPYSVGRVVNKIRAIEKRSRPFMVVWEELETWVQNDEGQLLALLDGFEQVDNVLYLATTNYIEKIPERIRNRPSRFADVIEIGFPSFAARRTFLEAKIHKEDKVDIDKWAEATEGFSIDHLKDLIISILVLGMPFEKAIERVKALSSCDLSDAEAESVDTTSGLEELFEKVTKSI